MLTDWIPGQDVSPGAWRGVPMAEYRCWPGHSKSTLSRARGGYPADWRLPPVEPTPAMTLGSAVDCLVFEGSEYTARYTTPPTDALKKDGTPYVDYLGSKPGMAWQAEQRAAGRTVLTAEQAATAQAVAGQVFAHPLAATLLLGSEDQVSLYWEMGGTSRMGRPDMLILPDSPRWEEICEYLELGPKAYAGIIADLKTCGPSQSGRPRDPRAFREHSYAYGYHLQLGWYAQGCERTITDGPWAGVLIQATTVPPYPVEVHVLGDTEMELGRDAMEALLSTYRQCSLHDTWPSTLSAARAHRMTYEPWHFSRERGY